MQLAINQTAAKVGLSPNTVRIVIETYQGVTGPLHAEYKCPHCSKEYKTARGLIAHLHSFKSHPKGKK